MWQAIVNAKRHVDGDDQFAPEGITLVPSSSELEEVIQCADDNGFVEGGTGNGKCGDEPGDAGNACVVVCVGAHDAGDGGAVEVVGQQVGVGVHIPSVVVVGVSVVVVVYAVYGVGVVVGIVDVGMEGVVSGVNDAEDDGVMGLGQDGSVATELPCVLGVDVDEGVVVEVPLAGIVRVVGWGCSPLDVVVGLEKEQAGVECVVQLGVDGVAVVVPAFGVLEALVVGWEKVLELVDVECSGQALDDESLQDCVVVEGAMRPEEPGSVDPVLWCWGMDSLCGCGEREEQAYQEVEEVGVWRSAHCSCWFGCGWCFLCFLRFLKSA